MFGEFSFGNIEFPTNGNSIVKSEICDFIFEAKPLMNDITPPKREEIYATVSYTGIIPAEINYGPLKMRLIKPMEGSGCSNATGNNVGDKAPVFMGMVCQCETKANCGGLDEIQPSQKIYGGNYYDIDTDSDDDDNDNINYGRGYGYGYGRGIYNAETQDGGMYGSGFQMY